MTLEELATREMKLSNVIISLEGTIEQKQAKIVELRVCDTYRKIFKEYSERSKSDIEALKRGLFLIWYHHVEPMFLTGIDYLDAEEETKIISSLEMYFIRKQPDYELEWMFSYYSSWHYLFKYTDFPLFNDKLLDYESKSLIPSIIDREAMKKRGQMGEYWISLNKFS